MAGGNTAPDLHELIGLLDSLDARERMRGLEGLRKYVGHRKVDQAVYLLRNDPDREVRSVARDLLLEAERRTSESLSVVGGDEKAVETRIDELIAELSASDPTDRVTALKELRMHDHPRAFEAVKRMRKDSNRVVRMLAEKAVEDRATGENAVRTSFRAGVMVATGPIGAVSAAPAGRNNAELVPMLGIFYLAIGLPLTLFAFWLWLGDQALLEPGWAPDPSIQDTVEKALRTTLDPLTLALVFSAGLWVTSGGAGLLGRKPWGRRSLLAFHSLMVAASLLAPSAFAKIILAASNIAMVFMLTRPAVVRIFDGDPDGDEGSGEPPGQTDYGTTERKVW